MSNRSYSFLKRLKTQKSQRSHLQRPRPPQQQSSRSPKTPSLTIQKIQLQPQWQYVTKCMKHPLKKGLFQPKQSLTQAYCQQCSIKLVKNNIGMARLTEESLYLRALYEAELEKLNMAEERVRDLIGRYFQGQREMLRVAVLKAKEGKETKDSKEGKDRVKNLPHWVNGVAMETEFFQRVRMVVGELQLKKVMFVGSDIDKWSSFNMDGREKNTEREGLTVRNDILAEKRCFSFLNKDRNNKQNENSENINQNEQNNRNISAKDSTHHRLISLR